MGKIIDETKTAIRVEGVGKVFAKKRPAGSVKDSVLAMGKRITDSPRMSHDRKKHLVLENINFDIKKGEFFGIVGRNGSGKSTLLKILAGVYAPTTGKVTITGKLTPFIELGVGFNPELSGRDNVFLNGALLGFNRDQMKKMYQDIVDFAELDDFMDVKLKNYSSGMQVRLAFSIATRCESDILLLDEVLAVGDAVFQQKCFDYFSEIKRTGRTVCFVSHDASVMRRYCDRGMYIKDGKVCLVSNITDVLTQYQKDLSESIEADAKKRTPDKRTLYSKGISAVSAQVLQQDQKVKFVKARKEFQLVLELHAEARVTRANVGVNIVNQLGQLIHAFNTDQLDAKVSLRTGANKLVFTIDNVLTDGGYTINIAVVDLSTDNLLFQQQNTCRFKVDGTRGHKYSLIHPAVHLELG